MSNGAKTEAVNNNNDAFYKEAWLYPDYECISLKHLLALQKVDINSLSFCFIPISEISGCLASLWL